MSEKPEQSFYYHDGRWVTKEYFFKYAFNRTRMDIKEKEKELEPVNNPGEDDEKVI